MSNNSREELPQEAKALEKTNKNLGNSNISANKLLYILMVEDPAIKAKSRLFATAKVDRMTAFADIIGYEITNMQSQQLKTWDDVTRMAEKGKMELISISFPWSRVISIRNVSYKSKNA